MMFDEHGGFSLGCGGRGRRPPPPLLNANKVRKPFNAVSSLRFATALQK
ncbi:hypothetical protein M2103_000080 [Ereboglobus sp. PH5-5]|nr:hypothetical protein [Ereboglobus sp. PH5-5]MDF9831876.1 hypothetical protein [Ereboglobus sp. PH5-5]